MTQGGSDELVGRTIRHYRILDRIGQGGMGVVYRAEDTSLRRTVALKFLPSVSTLDERAEERLINEARAASALDHPNIATIHEVARTEAGQLYIVMAFYEGPTLADIIARGPLPVDDALDYLVQIARGLERAREHGITHRDIKPGNVIVTERGVVKILDFGIAKVQDSELTMTHTRPGTLGYMSPEHAAGDPVDHRSDLWALGVVLYEMLTGRRPFDAPNAAAVLFATVGQPHEPVRERRGEVPPWLGAVVDRLLEKDPDLRFQSAGDVLRAVASHDAGMRAAARRSTPGVMRRARMHPRRLWALGTTALAVAAVASWWVVKTSGWPTPSLDREAAREATREGLGHYRGGLLELAQAELERALMFDSSYVEAWSTLAAVHVQQGDYPRAAAASRRGLRLDSTNTAAHYNLGLALHETGESEAAELSYRRAIHFDSAFVPAYSALSDLLVERGDPAAALNVVDQAEAASPVSPYQFLLLKNRGKAHMAAGEHARAIPELERSLELREWPETLALLAQALEAVGRAAEAGERWARYVQVEPDPAVRAQAEARRAR